jgi:hypothetical protein
MRIYLLRAQLFFVVVSSMPPLLWANSIFFWWFVFWQDVFLDLMAANCVEIWGMCCWMASNSCSFPVLPLRWGSRPLPGSDATGPIFSF